MTEPSRCTRCGTPLASGASFCSRCGFDVSGVQGGVATAKMAAPADEDPQAGLLEELRRATLGDYDIAGELGRGGMATVYLAHEIALERKVAIKVMAPALLQGGRGMADRFKREARTAAALSHPHIIPVYGVRESGRLLFFIMKYVHGRSLDAIVKDHGALPIKMVQAILAQAGSALDYAHRHGIIHRDIKPANIMLDVDGWAVVTDFGIAKVTQSQGLTVTGATIGTPTYMSPEQCAARDITGATDQYSLGVAAYEMLTGQVPFDADSVMSLMWKHFHEPPRPIVERRPDCPPELARAIERMLAKAPADRWPSLEEAIEAIGTPAHNDPIRQQMKALAKGSDASQATADRHTPISPVPRSFTPPAPTTPMPAPAAAAAAPQPPPPPPALPVTPLEPIFPSLDVAQSPLSVVPPPKVWKPRQPAPAPPSQRARRTSTSSMPTARRVSRAEPAPVIPPPFAPARRPLRVVGPALALVATGFIAWAVFGRTRPAPLPDRPPGRPAAAPVASVTVTPSPVALAVRQTAPLSVVLKDGRGNTLTGRPVVWTSTDSSKARVSATGLVTAVSPGYVTVTAGSEGRSGTGTVMVTATAVPVASVDVSPATASIVLGDTAALIAAPQDDRGNTLSGHTIRWSSSDPRIASVSPAGTVAALRLGTAVIGVSVEGKRDSVRITVTPPAVAMVVISPPTASLQVGRRTQLSATARDAHDRPVQGRPVEWRSNNPGVATVLPDGFVTAVRVGQASITALIELQSASASVTVNAVPVASVAVTPASLTLAVGKTAQLTPTLRDARGGVLRDRDIQWSSSNASVAAVSPTGMVTATSPGSVAISATSEGVTRSGTVTVPAPVVSVAVNPPPAPKPADSQPAAGKPTELPSPSGQPTAGADEAALRAGPRRGVAAGASHTCGITQSGAVACWGGNASGQLGDASAGRQVARPVLVSQTSGFSSLAAGIDYTCGLTAAGTAICWGLNARGQMGIGRTGAPAAPSAVVGNHSFVSLSAGARHVCGLRADGIAWCWGDNNSGQLGIGNARGTHTPQQVTGGTKFKVLAAGMDHTCGLATDGRVFCWGDAFSGRRGRGARESQPEPVAADTNLRFTALAAGDKHACALTQVGKAFCWGANVAGELGDGSKDERDQPVPVAGSRLFVMIAAGREHTCALTDGGDAFCWGRNKNGELGDGSRTDRAAPVKVAADLPFVSLSAGGTHTCGVTRAQTVLCWGGNARGQLGDGTATGRPSPAPVEAP